MKYLVPPIVIPVLLFIGIAAYAMLRPPIIVGHALRSSGERAAAIAEAVRAHSTAATFFSAYPEAAQRVRTESRTNHDVSRIATAGD